MAKLNHGSRRPDAVPAEQEIRFWMRAPAVVVTWRRQ
jgi:hypothetical protein